MKNMHNTIPIAIKKQLGHIFDKNASYSIRRQQKRRSACAFHAVW